MPNPDLNASSGSPAPTSPSPPQPPAPNPITSSSVTISQSELAALLAAGIQAALQHHTIANPTQQQSVHHPAFVGPPSLNPASGESPSLPDLFPEVEAPVLALVAKHELPAADLYKLDARYRDKPDRSTLELEGGSLRIKGDAGVKDYPSLSFIFQPLVTYFTILTHTVPRASTFVVATATMLYIGQLQKLAEDYEWHAVLKYHLAFFQHRRRDMLKGDFYRWGMKDIVLADEYLGGFRKTRSSLPPTKDKRIIASEVCRNFNNGICASPCRHNRAHKCATCGSEAHGASTHAGATKPTSG